MDSKNPYWVEEEADRKLGILLEAERSDDNLANIVNTKIQVNREIKKEEVFWEQRARVN